MFTGFFKKFLDLFFPITCLGCKKGQEYVCKSCFKKIVLLKQQQCPECYKKNRTGLFCNLRCKINYNFDQLVVCTFYSKNNLIKKMITVFKYKFSKELSFLLAEIMKKQFDYFFGKKFFPDNFIIVPVPIHKKRLKQRGFNQIEILCKNVFGLSRITDCLTRNIHSENQAHLSKKNRLKNLKNAFSLKTKYKKIIKNKSVLLIDDVCSTGATLNECSKTLKQNGAKFVCGFVIARGKILKNMPK